MNYLAHVYIEICAAKLARQPDPGPYALGGAILPDLWRKAHPGIIKRAPAHLLNQTGPQGDLARAWQRHVQVDRYFHNWFPFKDLSLEVRKALEDIAFEHPRPYRFVMAHILVELKLDQFLLQYGYIQTQTLYGALDQFQSQVWKSFGRAMINKGLKSDKEEKAGDLSGMQMRLERFTAYRYMDHYIRDEGIVQALHGILNRVMDINIKARESDLLQLQTNLRARFQEFGAGWIKILPEWLQD